MDTIVAISSPPGRGAVGLVRLSGKEAFSIASAFCRKTGGAVLPADPRKALHTQILEPDGKLLDSALFLFLKGPASYTGEDTVELTCHGNPLILRRVVELCLQGGARPATAGEFTLRAFRNGKLDLVQAESVKRIVEARSRLELFAGQRMQAGILSRFLDEIRSKLIGLKAEIEAEIDFSTEDLTLQSQAERHNTSRQIIQDLEQMIQKSRGTTEMLSRWQITLVGLPNAGKSSLLNALLKEDRALVSDIPGTTRDTVAEDRDLAGTTVRLVDTAGLRSSSDPLEQAGMERTRLALRNSQIIVHVVDGSLPAHQKQLLQEEVPAHASVIVVLNKCDRLHPDHAASDLLAVSAKTGEGLAKLEQMLESTIESAYPPEPVLLEIRQMHHLKLAASALQRMQKLQTAAAPPEIVALEIQGALDEIGAITGAIDTEEVLGKIFSTFCIGK